MSLFKREDDYFQTPAELAADLIGFYLLDHKQAKQQMPKATKLVRDLLNGSDVVTFFSMPLAGLVAVILANMFNADREEEEQQMAGVLSPGARSIDCMTQRKARAKSPSKDRTKAAVRSASTKQNYFSTLMDTPEGRELRRQWSTKKRKNPGRPERRA